jgi:molybdate transport system ATP-binding protein
MALSRGSLRLALELHVRPGEVVALLGPNGAGKSTAIRVIAGLLRTDAGRIELGDAVLADAATGLHRSPHQRAIGVVFQDYLLFPHLTVLDNVAFGPRVSGTSTRDARVRARHWLGVVGASELAGARPRALSGGQAQRVALARALATQPQLLLLDEPLAALDARTRLAVRGELRRHLQEFGGAAVLVTHDPIDAAVLADRLVVLESGSVVQAGTPADVARRPRTDYVAQLVGLNLIAGHSVGHRVTLASGGVVAAGQAMDGPCFVAFRPDAVALFRRRPEGSPRNVWPGRIVGLEPYGDRVRVELGGTPVAGERIVAEVTQAAVIELGLRQGEQVWASVKASEVASYPGTSPTAR